MEQIELDLTHDYIITLQVMQKIVVRAKSAKEAEEIFTKGAKAEPNVMYRIQGVVRADYTEDDIYKPEIPKGGPPKGKPTGGGTPRGGRVTKQVITEARAS